MRFFACLLSLLLTFGFVFAGGCSEPVQNPADGGTTPPDAKKDTTPLRYQTCESAKNLGGFRIDLASDFTGIQGQVFDGVTPQNVPNVLETVGLCKLLRPKKLFCDPPCSPGQSCDEKGKCIASPKGQDVGSVTITGMKAEVSMTPRVPIYFYTNKQKLPHPGFEHGGYIRLAATGGKNKAFVLRGWGVSPLVVTTKDILVKKKTAIEVTWEKPTKQGPTRIHLKLNINNHGGTPSWIECEVPDEGKYTIPESLITKLFDSGVSGFPDLAVTRRSVDSADIAAGCVQMGIYSTVTKAIQVEGVTSCSKDADCPKGKKCRADLTCG